MARAHILVVEDNLDNLTLIIDALSAFDYQISSAQDGEAALAAVRERKPDLILMDLSLPLLDGWTLARSLKADATFRHIPIIALTAHAMAGDRDRALAAGCDDYLPKPINLRELRLKIGSYLG
jgi:two-component system cell cycle response regulator DivK